MDGKKGGMKEGYAYIYGTYQYVALNKDAVNIFAYSYYYCCAVLSCVHLHPSAHRKAGWLPQGTQHPGCPLPCLTRPTPRQRPRIPENPLQSLKPCSGPRREPLSLS